MIKMMSQRTFLWSTLLLLLLVTVVTADERNPFSCIYINYSGDNPTSQDTLSFLVSFDDIALNFDDVSDLVITETGTVTHTGASGFMGGMNFIITVLGVEGDGTLTLAVSTESDVQNGLGEPLESSVTSEIVYINNSGPAVPSAGPVGIGLLLLCSGALLLRRKVINKQN